jgi:hypothetical protein
MKEDIAARDRITGLEAALRLFAHGTIISHGDGIAMLITEEQVQEARAALQEKDSPEEEDAI